MFEWVDLLHLIEQVSTWDIIKNALWAAAPVIVAGALYVVSAANPPLGLAAGLAVGAIQGDVLGMGKDMFYESAKGSSSKLVSRVAGRMSNGLTYLGIVGAFAESGRRLGEVIGTQMDRKRNAYFSKIPRSWQPSVAPAGCPAHTTLQRCWIGSLDTRHPGWRGLSHKPEDLAQVLGVPLEQLTGVQPR